MSQGEAAVSTLESKRKEGLGDRLRGQTWDKLPLHTVPLVASPVGIFRI